MDYNKKEYENKEYYNDGSNGSCDSCGGNVEERGHSHCEKCNEEYENACSETARYGGK